MDKISQTLVTKISKLQRRFEALLENDFTNRHHDEQDSNFDFETSRDLSLIKGISDCLPNEHIDRTIVIFTRLAAFFDAGILMENNDGHWKSQAYFKNGKSHLIKPNMQRVVALPNMNLMTVLKANSSSIINKLHLPFFNPDKEATCVLIKVTPDFSFLLISKMPDLWLKDHTENIRRALINGFTE